MGQTHTKCNDLLLPPLFGKRNLSAATGLFKCYRHCFPWKFLEQSLTLCRGLAALIFAAQGMAGIGLARRSHAKGTERPVGLGWEPTSPELQSAARIHGRDEGQRRPGLGRAPPTLNPSSLRSAKARRGRGAAAWSGWGVWAGGGPAAEEEVRAAPPRPSDCPPRLPEQGGAGA